MRTIAVAGIAGLLILALAPQVVAQESASTKSEPTRYLRVKKDQRGRPTAMQTAVVRFVPQKGEGELVVDLVGAVHYGDAGYYRALNALFRQYDAVLYELVAPAGNRVPGNRPQRISENPLRLLQRMSQAAMGLESQLEKIDYTRKNFVHADLSPREMLEAVRKRGENGLTLMLGVTADLMRQHNLEQTRGRARRAIEQIDPFAELMSSGGTTRMKRAFALELEQQTDPDGGLGRTIGRILIDDRNAAAMRVFQKQMAQGKKRIAIFYGAAHMPDFERRLRTGFGLQRKSVGWQTAWNLERESGSAVGEILKLLGDELTRELAPRKRGRVPARNRAMEIPSSPATNRAGKPVDEKKAVEKKAAEKSRKRRIF